MKRYLMRGGVNPLDSYTPDWIIDHKAIGANSGNLLYALGVYRTLLTEDVTIDMDYYGVERNYTDTDIDRINNEYDAYICPLADAFRDEFAKRLEKYANFFNKLTIPVYVIGLGCRTAYEGNIAGSLSYQPAAGVGPTIDRESTAFVKAVLDKGTILGLRGENTGKYLKRLGFREEEDFRVIGCPSLYTFGRELPQRSLPLNAQGLLLPETKISVNMSSITPENVLEFLFRQMDRFPDHYCVEQNENEMVLLYNGIDFAPRQKKNIDTLLPLNTHHPLLQEDRYKFFIHPKPWFQFMNGMDLCVGSKLHGNVAGVLGGCPTLFIALDGRMRELADYHQLPNIPFSEIRPEDTLESVMARVDMQSHIKKQPENFDRYIQFLDDNKLDHIYKDDKNRKDAPLDKLLDERIQPTVGSILYCTPQEAVQRFNTHYARSQTKISDLNKRISDLNKQNSQLKEQSLTFSARISRKLAREWKRLAGK